MERQELVCIGCPIGCQLVVENLQVTGNQCRIGAVYGVEEVTDPRRLLTTSIKVSNLEGTTFKVLSVKTTNPVPKDMIFPCLQAIKSFSYVGNVSVGDVVLEDLLGLGISVVATRSIKF